jgi:hypothetical protein
LRDKGIKPCIPGRKSRGIPIKHDKLRYKRRNRNEIMFGRLKDCDAWPRATTGPRRLPDRRRSRRIRHVLVMNRERVLNLGPACTCAASLPELIRRHLLAGPGTQGSIVGMRACWRFGPCPTWGVGGNRTIYPSSDRYEPPWIGGDLWPEGHGPGRGPERRRACGKR